MAKKIRPKSKSAKSRPLVICDTNVVILMATFKPSVMFPFQYSFGEVEVHHTVIREIENWIDENGEKLRKFSEPFLAFVLDWCQKHTGKIDDVPDPELRQGIKFLDVMEQRLPPEQKGLATSFTDKQLLVLAFRRGAALATQELTLRSLAKRSLKDEKRLVSFEDMLAEVLQSGLIAGAEARSCLQTLDNRGEHLRKGERKRILQLIEELG